jgi:hypothetical protein
MSKFGRDKIALVLACASIFGSKTQAAQNVKTEQSLGAVRRGGATFDNSKALKKSKSMSNLTKGLIIGGSILGAGLIGYEVLGDTVIDKAPTLLKLIRGKKQGKDEQVAKENMQKIYNEIDRIENSEKWKKEFESTKELIMNYESNDIWRKISSVYSYGNMYTTNEEETDMSNRKLITNDQKKDFNSRLMKKFSDMFSGKTAIRTYASSVMPQRKAESIFYVNMLCEDNVNYGIQKQGNALTLKVGKLEVEYNLNG